MKNIGLDTKLEIYLRDRPLSSDIGIVNLHPTKRIHLVSYTNENYLDSYDCAPPQKLSKFIIKRNGYRLYSENKIHCLKNKRDSYCANYCLYILSLTKVLGKKFESAALKLYYQ